MLQSYKYCNVCVLFLSKLKLAFGAITCLSLGHSRDQPLEVHHSLPYPKVASGSPRSWCKELWLLKPRSYSRSPPLPAELLSPSPRVGGHMRGQDNTTPPQHPFLWEPFSQMSEIQSQTPQHLWCSLYGSEQDIPQILCSYFAPTPPDWLFISYTPTQLDSNSSKQVPHSLACC